MNVIVFASRKGGSGKSTLAAHLAAHVHKSTKSAVVEDAIRNATMVVIPARPGVFDVNAVQDTIQTCRTARKPYAVVLNGAPAQRDGIESRIVTIAREALTKFRAPVWAGQITNRADLLMALANGEGAREYYAEGRAAAEIGKLWAAIERSVKAIRGQSSAGGAMHKQAA
jgi:chromosome partitioning protein